MKSLGTIALTFLTVLMFALFIIGCEGDRGEDGKAGISGISAIIGPSAIPEDIAAVKEIMGGDKGDPGNDGCGFDQVKDETGACVHSDETDHAANHPNRALEELLANACGVGKVIETSTGSDGKVKFKCVDEPAP